MGKIGGVLLISKETGKFLLGERSEMVDYPNYWSVFGGGIEEGENVLDGVKRELYEETLINSDDIIYKLFEVQYTTGHPFYFYLGYCDKEIECQLNEENSDWGWFSMENLPYPLFPTLYSSLVRIF